MTSARIALNLSAVFLMAGVALALSTQGSTGLVFGLLAFSVWLLALSLECHLNWHERHSTNRHRKKGR